MPEPSPKSSRTEIWPGSGGSAAVEMALILPLFLILLTGLFDVGFAAFYSLQVNAAAAAGAQYATAVKWDVAQIASIVTTATGTAGITATPPPSQFQACPVSGILTAPGSNGNCPDGSTPGTYGTVSAQIQYLPVLASALFQSPMTLTGRAVVRLQ